MTRFQERRELLRVQKGERIMRGLLEELRAHPEPRKTREPVAAIILSLCVLLLPFVTIAFGLAIVFGPGLWLLGIPVILIGSYILPWPPRRFRNLLTRADAPKFFGLLDQMSGELGGRGVDGVLIDENFNAFFAHQRGKRVLGIGALLWTTATPQQRIALLAHELAHDVNGDPERGWLISAALQTLNRWYDIFGPGEGGRYEDIYAVVFLPFAFAVECLLSFLVSSSFVGQQRAEYLADLYAAKIAGRDAAIGLLHRTVDAELFDQALNTLPGVGLPHGRAMLELMAGSFANLDAERVEGNRRRMLDQAHSVDATHPPTSQRIAFLEAVAPARGTMERDANALKDAEAELAAELDKMGDRWGLMLERQ